MTKSESSAAVDIFCLFRHEKKTGFKDFET